MSEAWSNQVRANARRYRMGTEAHHTLGDISRDEPSVFYYAAKDENNYYGHWLTGFGFINVRFPADTTRALTDDELTQLAAHPLVIA